MLVKGGLRIESTVAPFGVEDYTVASRRGSMFHVNRASMRRRSLTALYELQDKGTSFATPVSFEIRQRFLFLEYSFECVMAEFSGRLLLKPGMGHIWGLQW